MKTYLAYTYTLISFLETLYPKLRIIKHAKLPKYVVGRCSYKQNWIKLDATNTRIAFMTLAHEGGHYSSYIKNKHKCGKHYEDYYDVKKREELAYLYGWALIVLIGATSLITKQMWKDFHE